ncbi:hypothetical protein [Algoriphagus aquimarinus]|uniref:DUF4221 domain-containing protein n=1 Tax=Algoriphagus aquimarinus TaxID=237018 RepID=A0A1I0VW73_9BACT|nr:hypothetical protein [Algoriphagus aquimarinus]SFA80143.1 hypothetical protein SAMN04489723_101391 [Algoriphagus aquimarinus]
MKLSHWFLALLVTSFFSCESPKTSQTNEKSDFKLEITDSIRVAYIGKLNLMDVNPEFERILLFDPQNMKFVSTDFEGNILGEFSKDRDAPDGFGFYPMGAGKFNASKNIQVVSATGIFEYDLEGNLLNSTKVPRDQIKPFSGRIDAKREIQFVNGKILVTGTVARGEFNKTQPEFYDTFLQLVKADPKTGNYEQFLNLDPESIFQNDMSHEPTTISTTFEVVNDELYVISGTDPFLNIYELDFPYNKVKRIPLQLKDYRLNQGEDPKKADPRAISYDPSFGIIHKLVIVGDKLVLTYDTGYDAQDALRYHEQMANDERKVFNTRIANKYKLRYQVLDLDGKLLSDSEIPEKLGDVFVGREGAVWFMGKVNPEIEEDYFTLYKVKIK